jgi:hypothetical protein
MVLHVRPGMLGVTAAMIIAFAGVVIYAMIAAAG